MNLKVEWLKEVASKIIEFKYCISLIFFFTYPLFITYLLKTKTK